MESIDMKLKSNNVNVTVGENIICGKQTLILTKCDSGSKLEASLLPYLTY